MQGLKQRCIFAGIVIVASIRVVSTDEVGEGTLMLVVAALGSFAFLTAMIDLALDPKPEEHKVEISREA